MKDAIANRRAVGRRRVELIEQEGDGPPTPGCAQHVFSRLHGLRAAVLQHFELRRFQVAQQLAALGSDDRGDADRPWGMLCSSVWGPWPGGGGAMVRPATAIITPIAGCRANASSEGRPANWRAVAAGNQGVESEHRPPVKCTRDVTAVRGPLSAGRKTLASSLAGFSDPDPDREQRQRRGKGSERECDLWRASSGRRSAPRQWPSRPAATPGPPGRRLALRRPPRRVCSWSPTRPVSATTPSRRQKKPCARLAFRRRFSPLSSAAPPEDVAAPGSPPPD